MWLLIYTALAQNGQTSDKLEFETKETCIERGIGLLEFGQKIGSKIVAVCENPQTGERIEIELPKGRSAA